MLRDTELSNQVKIVKSLDTCTHEYELFALISYTTFMLPRKMLAHKICYVMTSLRRNNYQKAIKVVCRLPDVSGFRIWSETAMNGLVKMCLKGVYVLNFSLLNVTVKSFINSKTWI